MQKKFEINRTKIKGGRKSGRKVVTHNSKSDLPLEGGRSSDRKYCIKEIFLKIWMVNKYERTDFSCLSTMRRNF